MPFVVNGNPSRLQYKEFIASDMPHGNKDCFVGRFDFSKMFYRACWHSGQHTIPAVKQHPPVWRRDFSRKISSKKKMQYRLSILAARIEYSDDWKHGSVPVGVVLARLQPDRPHMYISAPSSLTRRAFAASLGITAVLPRAGRAAEKVVRIGVQKYGTLIILRERKVLEQALQPLGWTVSWHEFAGGPQLLEALTAGALDFGTTGEAPPIFAQAAGSSLLYVGYEPPSPSGEAILVAKDSPIGSVADLKGRTVALNKGSNVHYLLVQALASAGLTPADIQPAYLAPADARGAFERGYVDAWAIWDPFLSAAQEATGARTLVDGTGAGGLALAPNRQFFLATHEFAQNQPELLRTLNAQVDATDRWAEQHQDEATRLLAASMGLTQAVVVRAVGRMGYGVRPLTPEVTADQQKIADTFFNLRLIPQKLDVASAVWNARS